MRSPEHAGDTHSVAQVRCPRGERAEILVVLRHGTQRLVLADVVQRTHGASTERVSIESVDTSALASGLTIRRSLLMINRRTECCKSNQCCIMMMKIIIIIARKMFTVSSSKIGPQ